MSRPLFDSPYLFGIHEPGGEQYMLQAGKPGWIVFTEAIGSEGNDHGGKDFTPWSSQGLGILCRLNNGYEPAGTIPHSSRYEQFAQRCANYVAASRGCKIWIIGNEMNHPVERPGVQIDWSRTAYDADETSRGRMVPWRFSALDEDTRSARMAIVQPGEVITPQLYARCYRLCRDAIHRVPGHADDQVLVGGVAPWNNMTKYEGNPTGDWVQYLGDILKLLGSQNCDGVTVHTYTHSPNPAEIYTDQYMDPPFQNRQFNFRAYRDFMNAVPASMRHLPAYITETDQDVPWLDQNNGWVKRAYGEIDYWNKQPGNQQIRALILYRWPPRDRWVIEGKQGVINDWREAMQNDYRWNATPVPPKPPAFSVGQTVYVVSEANLRRSPGYAGKPASDVIMKLPVATACTVLAGPESADGLEWWQARCTVDGQTASGWVAQTTPGGAALLSTKQPPKPPAPTPVGPLPTKTFAAGNVVANAYNDVVNVRRTPGYSGKDASDVLFKLPPGAVVTISEGPQSADALTWWRVGGSVNGAPVDGWLAEFGPKGQRFLIPAQLNGKINLGKPFEGKHRVTQLFADRPEVYKVFSYDGVPLRGHNGVDFGTPNGTKLLATDDGEVVQVGYEAKGFGNFVKLSHVWGESVYAHMEKVSVKEGDKVARGDALGLSDNTGNSSGPHLHFGVRIFPNKRGDGWGGYHDPIPFMNPADVIIPDNIRAVGSGPWASGMAPDEPGRERP